MVQKILRPRVIFFLTLLCSLSASAETDLRSENLMPVDFCAEWNPDFDFRGGRCCGGIRISDRRRGIRCSPNRSKNSFCDEMTPEQQSYEQELRNGTIPDVLSFLQASSRPVVGQAHCDPNNGFLAWGRPIVPSEKNRLVLRRPERCVHYGTDPMVGMLEWVGRKVANRFEGQPEYKGVHVLVGDVSAPRGGCLVGKGGRRGHASHTNGLDVDLGFLEVAKNRQSPLQLSPQFDPEINWWLLKQIFSNPFACIKKIFLDHRLIQKLERVAKDDSEWPAIRSVLQHVRRHKNHFHIRIGQEPGAPGCASDKYWLQNAT